MIDFKVEIQKYEPVLGADDVDRMVESSEIDDILDILKYIAQKDNAADKE
ncbi:MAG: hypothetical protein LBU32_17010 [Clostridiales bacterium]|jgi:hypothetical protein|nr:hypothetical protein [Clostridiales bacterium]